MKKAFLKYSLLFLGFLLLLDGGVTLYDQASSMEINERGHDSPEKEDRAETFKIELDEFFHFGSATSPDQRLVTELKNGTMNSVYTVYLELFSPPPEL